MCSSYCKVTLSCRANLRHWLMLILLCKVNFAHSCWPNIGVRSSFFSPRNVLYCVLAVPLCGIETFVQLQYRCIVSKCNVHLGINFLEKHSWVTPSIEQGKPRLLNSYLMLT